MDFISNREEQNRHLMAALGIESMEELFSGVQRSLLRSRPVSDDGLSELEVLRLLEGTAEKNRFPLFDQYLGAGAYQHHVPALVQAVCSKSEFLTAYTPYQPEISQGMLQAIFEYQSVICALTGMDMANGSLYDGAAACAEAILMALRHHPQRRRVVISSLLHPHYRQVINQYLSSHDLEVKTVGYDAEGQLDLAGLSRVLNDQTAAVLLQSPNFLGFLEPVKEVFEKADQVSAVRILCANPMSYGLFSSARELDADIAVGDSQPFGLPLQFGGPYVGYVAVREGFLRQLPGRIVGETVDSNGKRGFVLTLQAREQHIRREKATSNICTNQTLAALASLVAMLWYGPEGMRRLALTNYQRTAYLRQKLSEIPGIRLFGTAPVFNEFALFFDRPLVRVLRLFRKERIEPGLPLGRYDRRWVGALLIAATEMKSKEQLDHYIEVARQAASR